MRYFDQDWGEFIEFAGLWDHFSPDLRELLFRLKPADGVPNEMFGDALEQLVDVRIFERFETKERVRLHRDRRGTFTLVRAIGRTALLELDYDEKALDYLSEHFVRDELNSLSKDERDWRHPRQRMEIAQRLMAREHVQGFLDAEKLAEWESRRKPEYETYIQQAAVTMELLRDPSAAEDCRELVCMLASREAPHALTELHDIFESMGRERLGAAVYAAIRYALAFPALDPDDGSFCLTLWPSVARRMQRKQVATPATIESGNIVRSHELAWGLEDITQLLVAAATPIRLRGSDRQLFAKAARELEATLVPLPLLSPDASEPPVRGEDRIDMARSTALEHGWLEERGTTGKNLVLALTEPGRNWLSKPADERLRVVLDHVMPEPDSREADIDHGTAPYDLGELQDPRGWISLVHGDREPYVPSAYFAREDQVHLGICDTMRESFAPLDGESIPLEEFLVALQSCGLPDELGEILVSSELPWALRHLGEDALEGLWFEMVYGFLSMRLWRFGGLRLGWTADELLTAQLTQAGRYFLGYADAFEYGTATTGCPVRIQPDFEVVFLAPSPTHEAAFARFAERIGTQVGVLFRITRASIHSAANAGLSVSEVLAEIDASSDHPIPANVAHEIDAWFAESVRLELQPVLLLNCPSPEIAARVRAASGRHVEVAGETLLYLPDPKKRAEVIKACRRVGVFLEGGEPEVAPRKKRRRRRRMW